MNPITVLGICYDQKSSFLQGPASAPALIRKSLHSGASNYYAENGVSFENDAIKDIGDFTVEEYFHIEKIVLDQLEKGQRLLTLGGDHSITFPILKAYAQHYTDIQILHIDAHADLYHDFEGDPYSHACPFARIMESKLATRLVQVGIRTLNPHQQEQSKKYGVETIEMKDFDMQILQTLTKPIYLSLDLDGIDPAFAPGVSHHEPGGFSTRQVIDIIQSIPIPIIGADIVEYNPTRDVQGITAALAAKLLKEIAGKMLG